MKNKLVVSIDFMPCDRVNSTIKKLKEFLKSLVGRYSSSQSAGHITICNFEITEDNLGDVIQILTDALRYEHAQYVYFDNFASSPDGTFFIAPTVQSKWYFNERTQKIISSLKHKFELTHLSKEPHLTIARKLEQQQLQEAKRNLKDIDLDFLCDGVFVRIFNEQKEQLRYTAKYLLEDKSHKLLVS